MATTHYIGKKAESEKWGFSLCSPRKWGQGVTSDKGEVTCSRCAKILGITPAKKPESKNVKGTCACCFSSQKTQTSGAKSNGHLFHHGFERPGNGYIEGACPGHDFLPYEKSCEGTKYMLERAKTALAHTVAWIEHLKTTDRVTVYAFSGYDRDLTTRKHNAKYTLVTVVKGEPDVSVDCPRCCPSVLVFSFEEERDNQLSKENEKKNHIEMDIKFYEKMIAEWKAV